jgi:hypothetical protein
MRLALDACSGYTRMMPRDGRDGMARKGHGRGEMRGAGGGSLEKGHMGGSDALRT